MECAVGQGGMRSGSVQSSRLSDAWGFPVGQRWSRRNVARQVAWDALEPLPHHVADHPLRVLK